MTERERKIFQQAENILREREQKQQRRKNARLAQKAAQRKSYIGRQEWITDQSTFEADFYSYVRTRIPLVSNGIATWVNLCTAGRYTQLDGGTDSQQEEAQEILDDLDKRVYEYEKGKPGGFNRLLEIFFLSYFQNGRFCAEIIPKASRKGIEQVVIINPFSIEFKREGNEVAIYQNRPDGDKVKLPTARIMYTAFEPDTVNPLGTPLIDSIRWILEIKNKMLEDMARSSHNAGYPRLHIQVDPGEPLPGEATNDYVSRINNDFDAIVDAFDDIEVDDNIFTRSNVEIEVKTTSTDFNWSVNFERVAEEIIAGLRLYAWVLGLTHGTTKNWVSAQHDLLMQKIEKHFKYGATFLTWIQNTELALHGLPVKAIQKQETIRDPGQLAKERAEEIRQKRVFALVEKGYITDEEAKRILRIRE